MAGKNVTLRYGNTIKADHICSFRAYMISTGEDILAVRDHQVVSIPQAEADVTDPNNHWIVLRHDNQTYYCLYNLGTGFYLSIGSRVTLDDIPHKINFNSYSGEFTLREGSSAYVGFNSSKEPVVVQSNKAARFELLDNYYLTPQTSLVETLLVETDPEVIGTGIDEIEPALPFGEDWSEAEGASLANDIEGVYYYDLQGRRIGYALPAGEPVIAHIILRNGASIVRKIVAK